MAAARTPPPPPVIGKAGSYTIFITPPSTTPAAGSPRSDIRRPAQGSTAGTPAAEAPYPAKAPPSPPPPVQVPPQQFEKPAAKSAGSVLGFFWDAVAKVQNAHSSLDEHLANWFGLDQSRYQWALNDYFESSGKKESEKVTKPKEVDKGQTI
ncbi:lysine-rich arabinogalactan protein 19-like [Zingiber officinale]|uniref:Uncharacterized protein n=1 Tax=Zingiber officinale TaxID=94328 RepID=A0A8J5ERP9_ZINOF|nr:lysine-rich arabinogalactan protein 19-like [Zingiber officinale]XP_042442974.1 lysine-rich arabinogalactan protein 19-like [Zingiber officinale]KAG6474302.1 hypothetical protein ZIOFF_068228 [Zingiber officinale]